MVCILLGSGFEEAEALVPADLMRRAKLPVVLAGVDKMSVPGGQGIVVQADRAVSEIKPEDVDLLVLPGGLGGVEAMRSSRAAKDLILACHKLGKRIAAICAAPTLLAELGLLQGKKAVCYPGLEAKLTGALPKPDNRVVVDGQLITGEGPGSAFNFGLALVEAMCGADTAAKIRQSVHYHG